jgi:hypothetical protein
LSIYASLLWSEQPRFLGLQIAHASCLLEPTSHFCEEHNNRYFAGVESLCIKLQ